MATVKVRHSEGDAVYSPDVPNSGGKSLDTQVQAKVTELLRSFINDVGGQSLAAKKLGISQGYLSEVLSGNRGGGGKLIRGLAKYRPEIAELLVTGVSRATTLDPRYPNRDQAMRLLEEDGAGTPDEVRQAADAFAIALKSNEDLTVLEWVRSIDRALRDIRRGRKPTGALVTELGDEGIGTNFNNVIKMKKGEPL